VESQKKWHATLENSQTILPPTIMVSAIDLSHQQSEMYTRAQKIYDKIMQTVLPLSG
jgi:hypothetical protein